MGHPHLSPGVGGCGVVVGNRKLETPKKRVGTLDTICVSVGVKEPKRAWRGGEVGKGTQGKIQKKKK